MIVHIKLGSRAIAPVQRPGDSGADVHAAYEGVVQSGQTIKLDLDFALEIPEGYEAQIRSRSGLSLQGRTVIAGTIDSSYRGNVAAILHNVSREPWHIKRGDRVAQMVIAPIAIVSFEPCSNLTITNRGANGFGSTGIDGGFNGSS